MLDYDQMEYRLMVDYAGETRLSKQILEGLDVHQATANIIGMDRRSAKSVNFGLNIG
jgi:DNA polymerase I-like protein with 3'-5' exonuclease and polymerase domains